MPFLTHRACKCGFRAFAAWRVPFCTCRTRLLAHFSSRALRSSFQGSQVALLRPKRRGVAVVKHFHDLPETSKATVSSPSQPIAFRSPLPEEQRLAKRDVLRVVAPAERHDGLSSRLD